MGNNSCMLLANKNEFLFPLQKNSWHQFAPFQGLKSVATTCPVPMELAFPVAMCISLFEAYRAIGASLCVCPFYIKLRYLHPIFEKGESKSTSAVNDEKANYTS